MKELREVEKFGVTSHAFKSGDLKMVKVRRGKRGHRQSRSLVFRISRTSKPNSDDSSIKCSSTDEETSTQAQFPLRELKIRIPKRVLQDGTQNKETVEYVPAEHQVFRGGNKLNEDVSGSRTNALCDRVNAPNPNESELRSNRSILCPNSRVLNDGSKETVTRIAEAKSNEPRRSSRRIVLRVQKECQPNYPVKEAPKSLHTYSFGPSRRIEPQVCLGEKRKRGRKPAARGANECNKKRKYGRRGRPPKSPPKFPKQLSFVKTGVGANEKVVIMAPPKNSVWTLVPKELFESEFFKSQLLQTRRPTKRNFVPCAGEPQQAAEKEKDPKRPTVIYFKKKLEQPKRELRNPPNLLLPNRVSKTENDMLYLFNKYRMFQDIILKNYYELAGGNLNETENMLSNFLSNRSDVSRVKKASNSCEQQVNLPHYSHEATTLSSHSRGFSATPQLDPPRRFHSFITIWRRGSLGHPVLLLLPSGDHVRGLRVGSNVIDLNSAGQASCPASSPVLPSSEPTSGDPCRSSIFGTEFRDTLSRQIILQSLHVLYSDEAVLG